MFLAASLRTKKYPFMNMFCFFQDFIFGTMRLIILILFSKSTGMRNSFLSKMIKWKYSPLIYNMYHRFQLLLSYYLYNLCKYVSYTTLTSNNGGKLCYNLGKQFWLILEQLGKVLINFFSSSPKQIQRWSEWSNSSRKLKTLIFHYCGGQAKNPGC